MSKLAELLKSETPTYTLQLPLSDRKISYRPFRVKEEKILLLALEEGTEESILLGTKNLVESCCDDIDDAGKIPMTDLEYLFLHIRAKSIGEDLTPTITCPETDEEIKIKIPLKDIKIKKNKDQTMKLVITDEVGITMTYPTIDIMMENNIIDTEYMSVEENMDLIVSCIDDVWTGDEIFKKCDVSKDDIMGFVESMSTENFKHITNFFKSIPKIEHQIKYKTKDGTERTMLLRGLESFFE